MSSTAAPDTAPPTTLTFAGPTAYAPNITNPMLAAAPFIQQESLIQPDGSLTVIVFLRLATENNINPLMSFVNVMVYTKLNGAPATLEIRKTKGELDNYLKVSAADLSNPLQSLLKRTTTNSTAITHIGFRFDNVLLPLSDGSGLPYEVLSTNAYEQQVVTGLNFSIGYQTQTLQGISITVAQNPGKPTVSLATGQNSLKVTSGSGNKLTVTAGLRITFPQRTGGSALKSYNIYMQCENQNTNQIVAQKLNQPVPPADTQGVIPGFVEIEAGVLAYVDSVNDNDLISFYASVDNLGLMESALSDPLSFSASLKSVAPQIMSYKNAEILTPFSSTYSGANDIPGVRFTFTGNPLDKWLYVSLWCRLSKPDTVIQDSWRMAQMWSRSANNNDINTQLATNNGVCELVWNQKYVTTIASVGINSLGPVLPCMTAFDVYLILSENPDIANVAATLLNNASNTGLPNLIKQSQSNPSSVVKFVTSIFTPTTQAIATISTVDNLTNTLLLSNTYSNATNNVFTMPASHLQPYFSEGSTPATISTRLTLRGFDFTSNGNEVDMYKLSSISNKTIALTSAAYIANNNFSLVNSSASSNDQWSPNYEFVIKNVMILPMPSIVETILNQILQNGTTASSSTPPVPVLSPAAAAAKSVLDSVVLYGQTRFLQYYNFSSIDRVRSKPVLANQSLLPVVYINQVMETRLWQSGSGPNAQFGKTQLATFLKAVQAYDSGPYKWRQLEIQVATEVGMNTNMINAILTTPAALQAEILYLGNSSGMADSVIGAQSGLGTVLPNFFNSFSALQAYYLRLKLRYTWTGCQPFGTGNTTDQYYDGPWFGSVTMSTDTVSVPIVSLTDPYLFQTLDSPPPPIMTGLVVSRVRGLRISVQVSQPEPVINTYTNNKLQYVGAHFQVVDAFNNHVSWPKGTKPVGALHFPYEHKKNVKYNQGVTGSTILEVFSIPPDKLDSSYSISCYAEYIDTSGKTVLSASLRSPDMYFENIPIFTNLVLNERSESVQITAHVDLGERDQVPINSSSSTPHLGPSLTNNIYQDRAMYLTLLIPALVSGVEQFSHLLTWNPAILAYQSNVLQKVANVDIYGSKTNFIIIASNNTGTSVGMYPLQVVKAVTANTLQPPPNFNINLPYNY